MNLQYARERLSNLNGIIRFHLSVKADPPMDTVLEAIELKKAIESSSKQYARVRDTIRKYAVIDKTHPMYKLGYRHAQMGIKRGTVFGEMSPKDRMHYNSGYDSANKTSERELAVK